MTGGDFSLEAYQQLREAYANETNTQLDAESQGVEILGQKMTLETLPVDSPWRSQIEDWKYPSGRSQYLDEKQDPAEILEIMRGSAKKLDDAEKLEEAKELVAEAEAEAEEAEETDEAEEAEEAEEMSDEEFDKFIAEILEEDGDEEVEEESADETEDNGLTNEELDAILEEVGEEDEDEEEEEEEEEKEDYDPQVVADEISRLRAELDNMRFVPEAEQAEDTSEEDSP